MGDHLFPGLTMKVSSPWYFPMSSMLPMFVKVQLSPNLQVQRDKSKLVCRK